MKTWNVKYSYCEIGSMVWQGGPIYTGELTMEGATYENVRVDLRGLLAKGGYNLYRFIAVQIDSE